MNSEVLNILDRIGYSRALKIDRSLTFQFWEPNERGARHFKDKNEAKECMRYIAGLSKMLQNAPPQAASLINDQAKSSDDWEQGRDPFFSFAHAVVELQVLAEIETDLYWTGRGASPKLASEDVVRHMAEIFVLGMGEMPGSGGDQKNDPSGPFPNAVNDMLKCIGFHDNFRRPCIKAVDWLKADDHKEFNRLMQKRKLKGRHISIFHRTVRNTHEPG